MFGVYHVSSAILVNAFNRKIYCHANKYNQVMSICFVTGKFNETLNSSFMFG